MKRNLFGDDEIEERKEDEGHKPEGGGVDLDEPEVGGDPVADGDLDDVAGDDLHGLHLLHAVLVRPDHLAGLRLVLLERVNRLLGVPLLGNQRLPAAAFVISLLLVIGSF